MLQMVNSDMLKSMENKEYNSEGESNSPPNLSISVSRKYKKGKLPKVKHNKQTSVHKYDFEDTIFASDDDNKNGSSDSEKETTKKGFSPKIIKINKKKQQK